jgi:hypothetical protein
MIVHKTSAQLDEHRGIILHAFQRDHFRLNKFDNPKNADFLFISEWIAKIQHLAIPDAKISPLGRTHVKLTLNPEI